MKTKPKFYNNNPAITMESFKIAYPELYADIVREVQLGAPSLDIEDQRTSRQEIAKDVHTRLNRQLSEGPEGSLLPIEERVRAIWDRDSNLRAEFRDNFDSYLAFMKQSEAGNVRIFKKGGEVR